MATDSQVSISVQSAPESEQPVVVNEVNDDVKVGEYIGQCKWFNDRYGYGFVTIQAGGEKGKDIFVHHSGIKPLNSNYKTLKKGEYVNFNIVHGDNGLQAVDVTGIGGGSLMCDVLPSVKYNAQKPGDPSNTPGKFTTVTYRRVPQTQQRKPLTQSTLRRSHSPRRDSKPQQ